MYFQCKLLTNFQLDVGGQYLLPEEVENIILELQIENNTSVAFILFDFLSKQEKSKFDRTK